MPTSCRQSRLAFASCTKESDPTLMFRSAVKFGRQQSSTVLREMAVQQQLRVLVVMAMAQQ
eukprot:678512-Pleurochrysis_carterae.AAC.1